MNGKTVGLAVTFSMYEKNLTAKWFVLKCTLHAQFFFGEREALSKAQPQAVFQV